MPPEAVRPAEPTPAAIPTVEPQAPLLETDELEGLLVFEKSAPPAPRFTAEATQDANRQMQRSSRASLEPVRLRNVMRLSWEAYKANVGLCISMFFVASALFWVLYVLVVLAIQFYLVLTQGSILVFGVLAFWPLLIVIPAWLAAGVCQFSLNVARGKNAGFQDLVDVRPFLLPILVLMFVQSVLVGISVVSVVWLQSAWVALPALLPSLLLIQTPFVAIHQRRGAIGSLVESARLTVANFLPLCLIWITMFAIWSLTVLPTCGLASIAVGPFLAVTSAVAYLEMARRAAAA